MKKNHDKHAVITQLTKHEISLMPVVLPVDYGKVYRRFSNEMDLELHPDELLSHEMLDEKVIRHILTLSQCTHEAFDAMQTHNALKLQHIMEETDKLRLEVEELQKLVYTDTLTQCFNRKWFEDHCLDERHECFVAHGSLVMIDLNRFKRINDDFGHSVGDKVLVFMAKKLKQITPHVVRYGGDEFLLMINASYSNEAILANIENLFHEIEGTIFKAGEVQFKISFSYGICSYTPQSTFMDVLDSADKAMYHLKKGRRS